MTKSHILDLIIKSVAIFFLALGLERLITIIVMALYGLIYESWMTSKFLVEGVYFIIYYSISVLIILKTEKIVHLVFGSDEIGQSKEFQISENGKSYVEGAVKILGLVFLILSIKEISSTVLDWIKIFTVSNSLFINLLPTFIQLIISLILIRSPRWLISILRI